MIYQPQSIEELQQVVYNAPRLLPVGVCTKTALSSPLPGFEQVSLACLAGILSYVPQEFTFTALTGTRLSTIQGVLADKGQYMPFDPLFAKQGATLGGTVASGLNGPGRVRSGGLRDFILRVRYIDSQGRLVQGGGNVVKNAAGFDLPKLMVGSLGSLGILVELTFKVFPLPQAYTTLEVAFPSWETVLKVLAGLAAVSLDLDALDLIPSTEGVTALIRLFGLASVLPGKIERLRQLTGGGDILDAATEKEVWQAARDMDWVPAGWSLVKVPITPMKIPAWEQAVAAVETVRRYSSAGQVCWLATPDETGLIDQLIASQGLVGLVVLGNPGAVLLGNFKGKSFYQRIKKALDPIHRFREICYAP